MTGIDITVLSVIGISTLISLLRGFFRELLSLVGMIAASVLTVAFFDPVQQYMLTKMTSQTAAAIAAGASLFIGFSVLFGIINMIIVKFIRASGLTTLDRSLGVLFGLFRGMALVSLFFMIFAMMLDEEQFPKMLKESQTLGAMKMGAETLQSMIPDSYWKQLEETSAQAVKKIEEEKKKEQELKKKAAEKGLNGNLELQIDAVTPKKTGKNSGW